MGGMFDQEFVKAIAKAVVQEIAEVGVIVPRLMSLEQAATYLGMSKVALKFKALDGQIPSVRADKKYRFDKQDLDAWIQSHKQVA